VITAPTPTTPRGRSLAYLLVAGILIFALFIRLWHIDRESFWADEGWTMLLAKGPTLADVVITMADDQHPPIYFMLARVWMSLFGANGDHEIIIRLLSAFASLLAIAGMYRLATDHFSVGAGFAAALLLALADNEIMLAREARHYALMSALAILSSLAYLRYSRRPSRGSGLVWFGCSVLLFYTHYLAALLFVVQGLHALLLVRPIRRLADVWLRLAFVGLAWLPWLPVFIAQSQIRYTRPILSQSASPNTPETFQMVRGDLLGSQYGFTIGLLLLGLVYVAYKNGNARLRWQPLRPTVYLGLWVLFPVVFIVAINPRFPILTTRNFLLVTPAILLLVGHGLMNLDRMARRLALTVLVIMALLTVDAYHRKPPWREVASDILRYRQAAEPVLMDVWTDDFALRYHLGRKLGADAATEPILSMTELRETQKELFFIYLVEYLRKKPALWLAYWGQNKDGLLDFLLSQGFVRTLTLTEVHAGESIAIYRYDRLSETRLATFAENFALSRVNFNEIAFKPGQSLRVNLHWQALMPTSLDYSVSVFLLNERGQVVANAPDAPPLGEGTSAWRVGETHFDSHTMPLADTLPAGAYTVGVKIYWYGNLVPLGVNGQEYYTAGIVTIIE
jgi:4-amino-4-deoxy-L-arabinose transferase-like glycosyltransferase